MMEFVSVYFGDMIVSSFVSLEFDLVSERANWIFINTPDICWWKDPFLLIIDSLSVTSITIFLRWSMSTSTQTSFEDCPRRHPGPGVGNALDIIHAPLATLVVCAPVYRAETLHFSNLYDHNG